MSGIFTSRLAAAGQSFTSEKLNINVSKGARVETNGLL
jgi:hypothetical protein